MATLNKTKKTGRQNKAHANWMGGPSYFISNPVQTLKMVAASSFFGEPKYYHAGEGGKLASSERTWGRRNLNERDLENLREVLNALTPAEWRGLNSSELMEKSIDEALVYDAEATLRVAAELRNDWYIRTTPQVILVRAAHHPAVKGTGLVRRYASQIIKRADEPSVGLAYQLARYGKGKIPNSLKKAWKDYLNNATEYSLAKYRMENRVVKTLDVVNLVHPKRTPAVDKLMKGELVSTGQTWEAIRSAGGSWEDSVRVMGHMALLRNLRNFHQNGVDTSLYLEKLKGGVLKGKQLPFRYYSAFRELQKSGATPVVLDTVEECLELALSNLPKFSGRTISLCDNSGSATGTTTSSMGTMQISTIANLTGVITGKVSDEGHVGIFGDKLKTFPVRQKSSIFDQLQKADQIGRGIGGATEHGIWLFWDKAIKEKQHWDNVFVYSDMQAGHGGLYGNSDDYSGYRWGGHSRFIDVPKLIAEYRKQVNPNVNVFLVQVAGYRDTLVPEFYDRTYILGGWSDKLLNFAHEMIQLRQ